MTKPPSLFRPTTSTKVEGSPELFKELTGADWIDQIKIEDNISIIHIPPTPSEWEMMRFLRPAYGQYHKSAPDLCLHETQNAGAFTLHADKTIEKGTIITEYLGEWAQQSKSFSSYRWGPIDALRFRNCGGMVEDGFPNVAAFHLYGVNKLPLRILFVALETIPAGEMITINYGLSHSVKINYHSEYRLNAMIDFFKKNSLDQLFKMISTSISRKRAELGWNKCLELESLIAKVQYLFQTPSALMHLLIENIITPKEAFSHFDRIDNRFYILGFSLHPNRRQKEISENLAILKTYFLGPRLHDAALRQLINQIRIRATLHIFLRGVLNGGNPDLHFQESVRLNDCLDAIVKGNHELFLELIDSSKMKDVLMEEMEQFAHETQSPATRWFTESQSLIG